MWRRKAFAEHLGASSSKQGSLYLLADSQLPKDEYLKLFNARVTVLETLGGQLPMHEALVISKLTAMGVSPEDMEEPDLKKSM